MMFRYFLASCLFVGLVMANVDNNDLSEDSSGPGSSSSSSEERPKSHMTGGISPMDLTNLDNLAKVQNLSDFSIKMLNAKSNDMFHSSRIRVVDATRQLVAGLKYKITFYMGQTECAKNRVRHEELTQSRCPISDKTEAKFNKCTVTVWEKPWEKYVGMFDDHCDAVPRQEAMQSAK